MQHVCLSHKEKFRVVCFICAGSWASGVHIKAVSLIGAGHWGVGEDW